MPPLSATGARWSSSRPSYYQRSVGEIALASLPPELRKLGQTALADRVRRLHKALAGGARRNGHAQVRRSPSRR